MCARTARNTMFWFSFLSLFFLSFFISFILFALTLRKKPSSMLMLNLVLLLSALTLSVCMCVGGDGNGRTRTNWRTIQRNKIIEKAFFHSDWSSSKRVSERCCAGATMSFRVRYPLIRHAFTYERTRIMKFGTFLCLLCFVRLVPAMPFFYELTTRHTYRKGESTPWDVRWPSLAMPPVSRFAFYFSPHFVCVHEMINFNYVAKKYERESCFLV